MATLEQRITQLETKLKSLEQKHASLERIATLYEENKELIGYLETQQRTMLKNPILSGIVKIVPDENQITGLEIENVLHINNASIDTDEYSGTKGNLLLDIKGSSVYGLKEPIHKESMITVDNVQITFMLDSYQNKQYIITQIIPTFLDNVSKPFIFPITADGVIGTYPKETFIEIGANCCKDQSYIRWSEFPKSLVTIGESAFENCVRFDLIKSDLLPSTLKQIGKNAFKNCVNIGNLDGTQLIIDENFFIEENAFIGARGLLTLTIDQIEALGDRILKTETGMLYIDSPYMIIHIVDKEENEESN